MFELKRSDVVWERRETVEVKVEYVRERVMYAYRVGQGVVIASYLVTTIDMHQELAPIATVLSAREWRELQERLDAALATAT